MSAKQIFKAYRCETCFDSFERVENLKEHLIYKHSNLVMEHSELLFELISQKKQKFYKCKHCKMQKKSPDDLREHVMAVHKGQKLKCSQCDFRTSSTFLFNKHRGKHVNILTIKATESSRELEFSINQFFSCNICGFSAAGLKMKVIEHLDQEHSVSGQNSLHLISTSYRK